MSDNNTMMMMEPIVVKIQRPTIDEDSDSDFEILSDSGNEEGVDCNDMEKGYERLEDMDYNENGILHNKEEMEVVAVVENTLQMTEKIRLNLPQQQKQQLQENVAKKSASIELQPTAGSSASLECLSPERSTRFIDRLNYLLSPGFVTANQPTMGIDASKRLSDSAIQTKSEWLTVTEAEKKLSEPTLVEEENPNLLFPYRTLNNLTAIE